MPLVVFATAYDAHAVRAFEMRALDYLLKPFAPDRFRAVLAAGAGGSGARRAAVPRERLGWGRGRRPDQPRLARVLVRDGDRAICCRSRGSTSSRPPATTSGCTPTAASSCCAARRWPSLAARLDPAEFLQISRSAVVRLEAVRELQPWFHGDYRVVMRDGRVLMWSRRYRARSRHRRSSPAPLPRRSGRR